MSYQLHLLSTTQSAAHRTRWDLLTDLVWSSLVWIHPIASALVECGVSATAAPSIVQSDADVKGAANAMLQQTAVPLLMVSARTGQNINLLKAFFHALQPRSQSTSLEALPAIFQIHGWFDVEGVGAVAAGVLVQVDSAGSPVLSIIVHTILTPYAICVSHFDCVSQGTICVGDDLLLGPLKDGSFMEVTIKSAHRHRCPYLTVTVSEPHLVF
eukprot:m.191758 g.191758  ORF g.191758 m.191758 type:complete len:213 (+) comp10596_c0_seq12:1125-1763(+)